MAWQPRYQVRKAPHVEGPPIPEDEPCLVIRAQDVNARQVLTRYISDYISYAYDQLDYGVVEDLVNHLRALTEWQRVNQGRMKWPDRPPTS